MWPMHYSKTFVLPKYLRQTTEVKIWQKMEKGQEIGKHWLSLRLRRHDLHVCERSRRLSKRFGRSPYLPEGSRKDQRPFFFLLCCNLTVNSPIWKLPSEDIWCRTQQSLSESTGETQNLELIQTPIVVYYTPSNLTKIIYFWPKQQLCHGFLSQGK